MNFTHHAASIFALAAAHTAFAQSPHIRPDAVQLKVMAAKATVQRLPIPARTSYDPQVKFSQGNAGCTFNIGDIASAQASNPANPSQPALERRGVGRVEYVTVVEATPICVQR